MEKFKEQPKEPTYATFDALELQDLVKDKSNTISTEQVDETDQPMQFSPKKIWNQKTNKDNNSLERTSSLSEKRGMENDIRKAFA